MLWLARPQWRSDSRDHRLVSRYVSGNLLSFLALDEIHRIFQDENNREWVAERVGRTSGIVSSKSDAAFPAPADILRFNCRSDPDEAERESTITAGGLGELDEDELRKILEKARKLRFRP
jgi:hypothetical protein